jgi:hypothetical protein
MKFEGLNGVTKIQFIEDYFDIWSLGVYDAIFEVVAYDPKYDHEKNNRATLALKEILTATDRNGFRAQRLFFGSQHMAGLLKFTFMPRNGDLWMNTKFGCVTDSLHKN